MTRHRQSWIASTLAAGSFFGLLAIIILCYFVPRFLAEQHDVLPDRQLSTVESMVAGLSDIAVQYGMLPFLFLALLLPAALLWLIVLWRRRSGQPR